MALQDGWFSNTYIGALSNSFALNLADTTPGTFKGALYTSSVASGTIDFDQSSPAYNSSPFNANQASGPGYTAGGINAVVDSFAVLLSAANKVGWVLDPLEWTSTTITAAGVLIYAPGLSNRAVMYRFFGQEYPTNDGDYSLSFDVDGAWREKLRAAA